MKKQTKERKVILAEQFADSKYPILEQYHEWKTVKTIFLEGWDECEREYMRNLKKVVEAIG